MNLRKTLESVSYARLIAHYGYDLTEQAATHTVFVRKGHHIAFFISDTMEALSCVETTFFHELDKEGLFILLSDSLHPSYLEAESQRVLASEPVAFPLPQVPVSSSKVLSKLLKLKPHVEYQEDLLRKKVLNLDDTPAVVLKNQTAVSDIMYLNGQERSLFSNFKGVWCSNPPEITTDLYLALSLETLLKFAGEFPEGSSPCMFYIHPYCFPGSVGSLLRERSAQELPLQVLVDEMELTDHAFALTFICQAFRLLATDNSSLYFSFDERCYGELSVVFDASIKSLKIVQLEADIKLAIRGLFEDVELPGELDTYLVPQTNLLTVGEKQQLIISLSSFTEHYRAVINCLLDFFELTDEITIKTI